MRIRSFLTLAFVVVPSPILAQLSHADSLGIAAAVAPVMRGVLHSPSVAQDDRSLLRSGAPWNALLQDALATLDSTLITSSPVKNTPRYNVFNAQLAADSVVLNIGVTRCEGGRFGGGGEFYVVKRDRDQWRLSSRRFSGAGDGRC